MLDDDQGNQSAEEGSYGELSHIFELAEHFLPRSEFKIESLSVLDRRDDLQTLSTYANSVYWKLSLAAYHTSKALAAIPDSLPKEEPDKQTAAFALQLALMSGHAEGESMGFAQLETEAHTIAAAQALHSVADILAQAVYLALRLDLVRPMQERKRTASSVIVVLEEQGLRTISGAFKELIDSETFKYLAAFVNTTKHRSLMQYHFRWSLEDQEDFGLIICAFRFEDRTRSADIWPSITVKDFLNDSGSFMSGAADAIFKTVVSQLASFAGGPAFRFWFRRDID